MTNARKCQREACYNQRNGRECWDAIHSDGGMSYEWESEEAAKEAATTPSRGTHIGIHAHKFC